MKQLRTLLEIEIEPDETESRVSMSAAVVSSEVGFNFAFAFAFAFPLPIPQAFGGEVTYPRLTTTQGGCGGHRVRLEPGPPSQVDGEAHFTEEGKVHDQRRDAYLRKLGNEILRIPGFHGLRDPDAVRERIVAAIQLRRGH